MEFFKHKTNINFLGLRKYAAVFSTILFICSVTSLAVKGLNWGLDFTGGTQIQISYPQSADVPTVRSELDNAGYNEAVVQTYGNSENLLISIAPRANVDQQHLSQEVLTVLKGAKLERVDYVGPKVGQEMATKGFLAILVALLGTMIYIAIRFEYRFAIGSAVALVHDPVLIMGMFSFFQLEFNLTALAAVLAVIGYSLNDTIVIFDRIRENFRKVRKGTSVEIVNLSINQTLSRTVMTSATTLVVVLALFFLGGAMIHGFATAFIIGIVIGTYSSIYVAGALAVALGLSKQDLMPMAKKDLDDRP